MDERILLGEFELMLLLTIVRLGEGAYGVLLARELGRVRGREVALGSVYAALERMEGKGAVSSTLAEATAARGGRAKRYFRVTERGLRSMHETRRVLDAMWACLPPMAEEPV